MEMDLERLLFTVKQYGNYSQADIAAMDVGSFYRIVSMLEEQAKKNG